MRKREIAALTGSEPYWICPVVAKPVMFEAWAQKYAGEAADALVEALLDAAADAKADHANLVETHQSVEQQRSGVRLAAERIAAVIDARNRGETASAQAEKLRELFVDSRKGKGLNGRVDAEIFATLIRRPAPERYDALYDALLEADLAPLSDLEEAHARLVSDAGGMPGHPERRNLADQRALKAIVRALRKFKVIDSDPNGLVPVWEGSRFVEAIGFVLQAADVTGDALSWARAYDHKHARKEKV